MPRKQPGPPCAVCGEPSIAKKLCAKHYKRLQRHGHIDPTRPEDWGRRSNHPLWQSWKWTKREGRDHRWNDFWQFVSDVGDRPTLEHTLRRYRTDRPFGPDNWYWNERVVIKDEDYRRGRAANARAWRRQNPLLAKQNELRRRFGISLAEYEQMLAEQDGKCAICGQKDEWFSLAVDHCHNTKRIRGLLCSQCNRGIGLFHDKAELLEAAAAYLRHPKRLI